VLPINTGLSINIGTVVLTADANKSVTCNGIVISVGSPTIELAIQVDVLGVSASFDNGTVVVNAAANVIPSGVQLNIVCNNVVTWGLLSTGDSESWSATSSGGTESWTEVVLTDTETWNPISAGSSESWIDITSSGSEAWLEKNAQGD
jgi:hypothetical protein